MFTLLFPQNNGRGGVEPELLEEAKYSFCHALPTFKWLHAFKWLPKFEWLQYYWHRVDGQEF